MTKRKFSYKVSAEHVVTKDDLDRLLNNSERHYDGKCKSLSQQGGTLFGWRNQMTWAIEDGKDHIEVDVTFQTADILCKVMEMDREPQGAAIYWDFRKLGTAINEESQRINGLATV